MALSWLPVELADSTRIAYFCFFFHVLQAELLVQQVESKEWRKLCGMMYERIQENDTM